MIFKKPMTDAESTARYIMYQVKNGVPIKAVLKNLGYNKANEWHYVNWKYFADKDCPKSELSSYLVQLKNKDFLICDWETEESFGCF